MPEGIEIRHRSGCPRLADEAAKCKCRPAYRAAVKTRDRRKVAKTFDSLGEARRWRVEMLSGGPALAPSARTVRQAAEAFLDDAERGIARARTGETYKPRVLVGYRSALHLRILPVLGGAKLADVQRRDVQRIADEMLAAGLDPSTILNAIKPLRVLYRRAIQDGDVTVNPTTNLRLPAPKGKRDRIASPDEAARLLEALPPAWRRVWAVAFYAGLRLGEIRALRWEDVDLANGVLRVDPERGSWDDATGRPGPPKSASSARKVPIVAVLRDELVAAKMDARWTDGLVFGREPERAFHVGGSSVFRRTALRAWAAAGLEAIEPHECRHTFASILIAATVNARAIMAYMGHSSINVTFDTYGHLMPGNEDEAAALVDAYLERSMTTARLAQLEES